MKHVLKTGIFITLIAAMSSCSSMYQVLETNSSDVKLVQKEYVFENSDLRINYDLWTNGGKMSFVLTNKSDIPIYLDWDKSHFIYNGFSYEYWYDAEHSKSFYSSSTTSSSATFADALVNVVDGSIYETDKSSTTAVKQKMALGATNKYKPKKIIHIPPKSAIQFSRFSISKSPFFTCEFPLKNSQSSKPTTKTFSKDNTPLSFRNYLTYSLKESFDQPKTINNEFYVSSILNMNSKVFQGNLIKEKYCKQSGQVVTKDVYPYPYTNPNSFYIKAVDIK